MEKTKVLGLDLGTNSIGWAIVEKDTEAILVDKGVHIFQEGVNIEKNIESSKSAKRTEYRASRRRYFRRKLRKIETLKVLSKYELCPYISEEMLKAWQNNDIYPATDDFMMWQRTKEDGVTNPYYCRHIAVNSKLNLKSEKDRHTLGRVFYHLAQRRGFLSNRLEATKESEGDVKKGISELSKKIKSSGSKTLGDYFYKCYGVEEIRRNYTSRKEHYKEEFDCICRYQGLPEEMVRELERAIFYQRPLRSQKGTVGKCTFEKKLRRCPTSHPAYEKYRMLCFVNNIKIKTPSDDRDFRALSEDEFEQIKPLFYRKSKEAFDFEDIAKKIAGKGNYSYKFDNPNMPYLFNYKMSTTVSGSPVTARLMDIFGEDWENEMASVYSKAGDKSVEEIVNDIWHVLFTFDSEDKIYDFAKNNLQLDDENAKKFVEIKIPQGYAALSLKAIKKISRYLEEGYKYSHATFLANIDKVVAKEVWNRNSEHVKHAVLNVMDWWDKLDKKPNESLSDVIIKSLRDSNFELSKHADKVLYHPSMVEAYPDAKDNKLGSPRIDAVRNPMAMRTLFQLRGLINKLMADGRIDKQTVINVELARQLNNANMRKAIKEWQDVRERENKQYADEIREHGVEPTKDDILKYRLWIEQGKKCLYTDKTIDIAEFIGANPSYDIEHTIPRSKIRDNSLENKTLAQSKFNREVKRDRIPSQLDNFEEIKVRIASWKDKIDEFDKRIEKNRRMKNFSDKKSKDNHITKRNRLVLERNYWRGKYNNMIAEDSEKGFRNSQGVDAGVISKYAVLYLKSLFPNVYSVKGDMVAEFRKLWGLHDDDEKKERVNHVHHCVDAITIACIDRGEYNKLSQYYKDKERYGLGEHVEKPSFTKPWEKFTQDVKRVEEEVLVSHYTPDNFGKNSKKCVRVRGKVVNGQYIQGDTVRDSLHKETYYGAIKHGDDIKYVLRKPLDSLEDKEVDKIVDDVVKDKIKAAIREFGSLKAALASGKKIWMNESKGVPIKKVRCFADSIKNPLHISKHRDKSKHDYKRKYHVTTDGNHLMAIYEGTEKGKLKRGFELLSNFDAAQRLKRSANKGERVELVNESKNELPLKYILKTGTMVLFWENSPEEIWELDNVELVKRLYKVTGMSVLVSSPTLKYGVIELRHSQEARAKGELKKKNGEFKIGEDYRPIIGILHTQFNALVQGYDFELDITGNIKRLK